MKKYKFIRDAEGRKAGAIVALTPRQARNLLNAGIIEMDAKQDKGTVRKIAASVKDKSGDRIKAKE